MELHIFILTNLGAIENLLTLTFKRINNRLFTIFTIFIIFLKFNQIPLFIILLYINNYDIIFS